MVVKAFTWKDVWEPMLASKVGYHWEPDKARRRAIILIVLIAVLIQLSASLIVIERLPVDGPIVDGEHYIQQARLLHCCASLKESVQYGLYPAFLNPLVRLFKFRDPPDWRTASKYSTIVLIYATQAVVLAAATAFLLLTVLRTWGTSFAARSGAALALTAFLAGPLVVVWPASIMNETLTISALFLVLAGCMHADLQPKPLRGLVIAYIASIPPMFVRDSLAAMTIVFVFLTASSAVVVPSSKAARLLVVPVVGIMALVLAVRVVSVAGMDRTVENLANLVQLRMLPDDARRHFFVEHGLPLSPIVMARSGAPAFVDNKLFERDDELREFPGMISYRNWLRSEGAKTYFEFLVSHPGYLLRSIWHTPNMPRSDYIDKAADLKFSIIDLFSQPSLIYGGTLAPLPRWLADFLAAPFGWYITLMYLFGALTNYSLSLIRKRPASYVDAAAISAAAGLFIAFHSEAWDPWRHTVPFILVIDIALIIRASDAAAWLLARWKQSSRASGLDRAPPQRQDAAGTKEKTSRDHQTARV